jgi:hypothetical protein
MVRVLDCRHGRAFALLRRGERVRRPIRLHGPAGQEQAQDNTQHQLFLPGQTIHVL